MLTDTSLPANSTFNFCIVGNYKKFLKAYYKDPLPHDDKLFTLNRGRERGYIELAIIEKDDETSTTVALKDILKSDKDGSPAQLVLIEGTSGIGKTTLAWQVCHKWAKSDSDKDFEVVVLVRLRKQRAQNATTLEDLLPYDENTINIKELTSALGSGKGVLIVCDGFDELSREQHKNPVYELFCGQILPEAAVIVTTNPSASARFKRVCERNIHRELEIIGFTEAGITEFAKSIFKKDASTSTVTVKNFLSHITSNPPIYSMMYLPLSAVIVAKIYMAPDKNKTNASSPKTMSQLFESLTLALLLRYYESNKQDEHFDGVVMPSISKLPPEVATPFLEIAKIAYKGICKNKFVFNDLDKPNFVHLGLMRRVTRRKEIFGERVTYVFFHRALQEYMAALHIANNLSGLLDSSLSPAQRLHKQLEENDMLTRFLAGMCANNQHDYSNDVLQWLVEFLSRICFDRSRALQLVHCAYECPSIMDRLKVSYGEEKECAFIVVEPEVGTDWYAMGHCISHFDQRWGLHAISLRKENIELLQEGFNSLPSIEKPGGLKYLHLSKSEVSVSQVITSLGKFCQLECLDLFYINVGKEDEEALKKLIAAIEPKSLTYRTVNEYTHTGSLIPMLLDNSSLEELVVRTGSEVNMDTKLLPRSNTNLKKLTISCELVQPLAALLPNTSLTHLVVDTLVYDSDLPFLTSLIESHSTLQVLELGKIVDYASNQKPAYTSLASTSRNLCQLVEVAISSQLKKSKLHEEDYDCLPEEYRSNSTVCSR